MSGQASGWVLRKGPHPEHLDRDGKPYGQRARGLRSVLQVVADAANADGEHSHPGIELVMIGALYSRRQAINLLAELRAEGWVEVEQEGGGRKLATVYRIPGVRTKVQPAHLYPGGQPLKKGAVATEETVQSAGETVQPGVHPNVLATERSTKESRASVPEAEGYTVEVGDDGRAVVLGWRVPEVARGPLLGVAVELCEILEHQLTERGERVEGKAHAARWVLDMEQMLRLDERNPAQVRWALRWLHEGGDDVASFWRTNIRSPAKLRAQWIRIREQYEREIKPKMPTSRMPLSDEARRIVGGQYAGNGTGGPPSAAGRPLPSGQLAGGEG